MTERERMEKGLIYDSGDADILKEQFQYLEKMHEYNMTCPSDVEKCAKLLPELFGSVGANTVITPPFKANWGGKHVYLGKNVYANYNLTLVDDGYIYIGDKVMFGPNVTITTAGHPIEPSLRERALQFNKDVHIEENVWIGANVVILPGVTIGKNSVIGAGAVVTKDIPANVVAYGNPCRIAREINERDKEYFYKNERIDWENLG